MGKLTTFLGAAFLVGLLATSCDYSKHGQYAILSRNGEKTLHTLNGNLIGYDIHIGSGGLTNFYATCCKSTITAAYSNLKFSTQKPAKNSYDHVCGK